MGDGDLKDLGGFDVNGTSTVAIIDPLRGGVYFYKFTAENSRLKGLVRLTDDFSALTCAAGEPGAQAARAGSAPDAAEHPARLERSLGGPPQSAASFAFGSSRSMRLWRLASSLGS